MDKERINNLKKLENLSKGINNDNDNNEKISIKLKRALEKRLNEKKISTGKKALDLRKSKYIKRWKGKDGKWKYEYPRDKKDREKKSDRLIKRLGVREDMIRNLNYEKCYVYNKEGDIIFRKVGGERKILFDEKELSKMKHAKVFTHNHPYVASFSPEDLKLAFMVDIKEMRVADGKYNYSSKIDQKWSKEKWNSFIEDIDIVESEVEDVFEAHVSEELITEEESEENFQHEIWSRLSDKYKGFEYKRNKR